MVAFDGSTASVRAIRAFAASGLARASEMHVVCVDDNGATAWDLAMRGVQLFSEHNLPAQPVNIVSALPIADALLETRAKIGARLW
jgi:hypothetical protein